MCEDFSLECHKVLRYALRDDALCLQDAALCFERSFAVLGGPQSQRFSDPLLQTPPLTPLSQLSQPRFSPPFFSYIPPPLCFLLPPHLYPTHSPSSPHTLSLLLSVTFSSLCSPLLSLSPALLSYPSLLFSSPILLSCSLFFLILDLRQRGWFFSTTKFSS